MDMVKGLILAGGFGTRMVQEYGSIPKVLLPIGRSTVLDFLIEYFVHFGITEIALSLHSKADLIKEHLKKEKHVGAKLYYFVERDPRGSGGMLDEVKSFFDSSLIVINGDVVAFVDLIKLFDWHKQHKSQATLVVHLSDHPHDSDVVVIDSCDRVDKIYRPAQGENVVPLTNAGMFVFEPEVLRHVIARGNESMEQNFLPRLIKASVPVYAYRTEEYIKDMGTPERYRQILQDFS